MKISRDDVLVTGWMAQHKTKGHFKSDKNWKVVFDTEGGLKRSISYAARNKEDALLSWDIFPVVVLKEV